MGQGESRWVEVLTSVAVVVVLASIVLVASRAGLEYDEAVYLGVAEQMRGQGCPIRPEGPGAVYLNNPPLVMAVSAALGSVAPRSLSWARGVHLLVWVVPLVLLSVSLARRMFGRRAGLVSALALGTMPLLLSEAAIAKLDVPLAAWAVVMWWLVQRRAATGWLVLVAALATATRYQGAMLGGVVFVALVLQARREGLTWTKAVVGRAGWCLVGAGLGGVAWIIVATACGGDFLGALTSNLGRLAEHSAEPWFHRPLGEYWISLLGSWVGPFVLVGTIAAVVLRRGTLRSSWLMAGMVAWVLVNLAFCSVIGLKAERYFAPAMPVMCVLTSALVAEDGSTRASILLRRWVPVGAALAAALSLVTLLARLPDPSVNAHYARAGREVARLTEPDDRVMVAQVQLAHLARRHYVVSLFERDPERVLGWLRDPQARVTLIATDDRILTYHPQMPKADKERIQRYVREHFERRPSDVEHLVLWQRIRW